MRGLMDDPDSFVVWLQSKQVNDLLTRVALGMTEIVIDLSKYPAALGSNITISEVNYQDLIDNGMKPGSKVKAEYPETLKLLITITPP